MATEWQMRVDALLQICTPCGRANHLAEVLLRIGPPTTNADEQQIAGLPRTLAHVFGQQAHARRGYVRVTILLRLPGLDM